MYDVIVILVNDNLENDDLMYNIFKNRKQFSMFHVLSDPTIRLSRIPSIRPSLDLEKPENVDGQYSPFDEYDILEIKNITKIKLKSEKISNEKFLIKITDQKTHHLFFLYKCNQIQCFLSILRDKLAEITKMSLKDEDFINHCQGTIFMKSFFGNMQKKYLFISKSGLTASKFKETQFDLFIDRIKELWTRFELINDKTFVVFKTRYHLVKYEFAIPVKHCLKWAKAFCSLLQYQ